jgi:hypothetical protein
MFAALAACVVVCATTSGGCSASGVGDPCIPEQEYDTAFVGFDPQEVNVESTSFQCLTRLCLVNHFRGRTTCPYRQDATGTQLPCTDGGSCPFPPTDEQGNPVGPCLTPGGGPVATSTPPQPVQPQCIDRQAADAVYCSCRCANTNGKTTHGAIYCACPDGFTCSQLINPIGSTDPDLSGAYCVKQGTEYQSASACQLPCDPTGQTCAPPSIR